MKLSHPGIVQLSGNYARGQALSEDEEVTQSFANKMREDGATVKIRRTYETFLNERMETNPKRHMIYWTYE